MQFVAKGKNPTCSLTLNDCLSSPQVWNHFDAGECPGQAVGVKTQLDNGVFGFLPLKNLSDKHVSNPEERVAVSELLHTLLRFEIVRILSL